MKHEEYLDNVRKLNEYSYSYHVLNISLISDYDYDKLYKMVKEYEEANPSLVSKDSPTLKVGEKGKREFNKNRHIKKMYSLDNVFDIKTLVSWIKNLKTLYPKESLSFFISPKLDGLSLNLIYENGNLIKATTRGDGIEGEDVLKNVEYVEGVLKEIPYKSLIELRGEVLMFKKVFEELNKEREKRGEDLFKTARNASAGSLRQLDPLITKERKLTFIPWGVGSVDYNDFKDFVSLDYFRNIENYKGEFPYKVLNLSSDDEVIIEEAISPIVEEFEKMRDTLPYDIDGFVISLNEFNKCQEVGYTIRAPKFAVAYKFQAKEYITTINSVTWQVGRTGVLTPVAEVNPTLIDGVTVTRCTLHNLEDIKKKDIKLNDDVIIIRSGDVIPKILKPVLENRTVSVDIEAPKVCPCCGSETIITENSARCPNEECKDRIISSIKHMSSRNALNIDGLGEEIIRVLYDNDIVKNCIDVFYIPREKLELLDGFGEKKIFNLLNNIERSKECDAWRFLNALGINLIGEGASKKLTSIYGLDFLNGKMEPKNISINGIGIEMINSIEEYIKNNKEKIDRLLEILDPVVKITPIKHKEGITGKVFVLTGTMSKSREAIREEITLLGGKVINSVSNNVDYLVYGENAGSKYDNAQALDIKCITENELRKMMS